MEKVINYQLQQLRVHQLSQSAHDLSYYQRQVNILKQYKGYCSNRIGWELSENQNDVRPDRKRVYSCVLYIGFWHDEFIKNVHIDIEKLHEEVSAFGTVLKISPFPPRPPYKCAFVVFKSRAVAESARVGLSKGFHELFIQKITWGLPPACIEDTFNFDTGIGEALRLRPMTKKECNLLGHGFMRMLYGDRFIPSDIIRLCVSFYSSWLDLKIVFCDDKTGDIDLNDYKIKAIPIEANITLAHITEEIEDSIFREAVRNEYDRLCKLSREELKLIHKSSGYPDYYHRHLHTGALIKSLMTEKFGWSYIAGMNWESPQFDKIRWDNERGEKRNSLVHVWLKFKQIKNIYPVKTETISLDEELYKNYDGNRWVEVPNEDDSLKMSLVQIESFDENSDYLVIERCTVSNWREEKRTWPRAKGDDFRETMQVGDIVDVIGAVGGYDYRTERQCVVRYIYPKDHETKRGKAVFHYVGWPNKWDETLDINSDRIKRPQTDCIGPDGRRFRADACGRRRFREDSDWDCCWSYYGYDSEYEYHCDLYNGVILAQEKAGAETYECSKYSRSYKAKKMHPKKKEFRKNLRNYSAKTGNKRIENKMKKYKINYECLAI